MVGTRVLAPLWNRRNAALNDAAWQRLHVKPADHVLDVGFGGGYLLGRIAAAAANGYAAGVDTSQAMVAYSQKRYRPLIDAGRLGLLCGCAEALPLASGHFDKACSVNSIFYWDDAARSISELGRVLADNGLLVLCFTCRESLQGKGFSGHGLVLYDATDVENMLSMAGFHQIVVDHLTDRHRAFWCMTAVKASRQPDWPDKR